MKFENETGNRALGLYVDAEYVDVTSDILNEVVKQINSNCIEEKLDAEESADLVVAGLLQLFIETASCNGYHQLQKDLQFLSIKYGLSHIS